MARVVLVFLLITAVVALLGLLGCGPKPQAAGRPPATGASTTGAAASVPTPPGAAQAPAPASQPRAAVYTCPMHPEVRQSTPGRCPKCGMELEKQP